MSAPRIKRAPVRLYYLLGFLGLLIAAYLGASTPAFFRRVIIPRIAQSIQSDIQVGEIRFRPLTSLRLRDVRVTPHQKPQLFSAREILVRYNLISILRGRIRVDELQISTPEITIAKGPGTESNLDPLVSGKTSSSQAQVRKRNARSPRIEVRNVTIRDGLIRQTVTVADGKANVSELSHLNATLDQLQNGKSGTLKHEGQISIKPSPADTLAGKSTGEFQIMMTEEFTPRTVTGGAFVEVSQAMGVFEDAKGARLALEMDLAENNLRYGRLVLHRSTGTGAREGAPDGQISFSGPIEFAKNEARLGYEIKGIDRRLLNLVGGMWNVDFGNSKVDGGGRLDVSQLGKVISVNGKLSATNMTLKTISGVTPIIDFGLEYQAAIQLEESTALIQRVDVFARQNGTNFLTGGLDRPMNLSWGKGGSGFRESTFQLKLENLELADWRAFLGANPPTGQIRLELKAQAERDGRFLKMYMTGTGTDIGVPVGTNRISEALVDWKGEGSLHDLNALLIDTMRLNVKRRGVQLLSLNGLANYTFSKSEGGVQVNGDIDLPNVSKAFPMDGFSATSGRLQVAAQYARRFASTNISTSLNLSSYTGAYRDMLFKDYQASIQFNGDLQQGSLNIGRASFAAQSGVAAGGSFDLDGNVNFERGTARIGFKSVNLTESAIGPFVAAALSPNQLKSIALDLSGTATYNAAGESRLESVVQVSRLIVDDPSGRLPQSPFAASLNLDATQRSNRIDLRKMVLALGLTPRAQNLINVTGQLDLSPTNGGPSHLKIQSDGLDVTHVYDLFVGGGSGPKISVATPPETTPVVAKPMHFPIRQLDAELSVKTVYLRELNLKNWTAKAALSNDVLRIRPIQLNVNESPLWASFDADFSVPGHRLGLSISNAQIALPIFYDSFFPADKGRFQGSVRIQGNANWTDSSVPDAHKQVRGNLDVAATNLNISVGGFRSPLAQTVLDVVVGIPELISKPGSAVGQFLARLIGKGSDKSRWVSELTGPPVQAVNFNIVAQDGIIEVKKASMESAAFQVLSTGSLQLQPALSNSTINIPLQVFLQRQLAEQAGFAPLLESQKENLVRLPSFVTVTGTIGNPQAQIDRGALAEIAAKAAVRAVGGLPKNAVEKVGGAANVLEDLLSPTPASTPKTPPGQSPPPSNTPGSSEPKPPPRN